MNLAEWAADTLGHRFAQEGFLKEALTHSTYHNEHPKLPSNERLEFLGDAVVGMVMAQYLFERFPDLPEGELTKIRAAVVCEPSLASRARALGVGPRMRFGKGEAKLGGEKDSILADCFEALAAAIFLDAGLETARAFVLRELGPLVPEARQGLVRVDYKTRLQELIQQKSTEAPTYRLVAEKGPPHDRRFQVEVIHRTAALGTGWGRTKKEAEQEAARAALLTHKR